MADATIPIGIDLGTTFSCAAYWDPQRKRHKIIHNTTTPSVVAFTVPRNNKAAKSEKLVGAAARHYSSRNPTSTMIYDVKRLIGRQFSDQEVQRDRKNWPFKVEEGEKGRPMIECKFDGKDKQFTPEEIAAMILGKLKADADFRGLNQKTTKCVITVPAYFDNKQRQATKDAGQLAKLEVMRVVDEPIAAALAYGIDKHEKAANRLTLIIDLGGGTLDVTCLRMDQGELVVKSKNSDTHLGGADFDQEFVDYCRQLFQDETGIDCRGDLRAMRRL